MAGRSAAPQKEFFPHSAHKPSIKGSTKKQHDGQGAIWSRKQITERRITGFKSTFLKRGSSAWAEGRQLHRIRAVRLVISQLQRGAESFKEEEKQRWPSLLPGRCPPVSSQVKHLRIMRHIEITRGFNLPQTSNTACPIPPKKRPDAPFLGNGSFSPWNLHFYTELNWKDWR